ncbi:MAG: hypothetical protein PHT74_10390 [Methanoculleus horonobensis]|nr:hypothetical protein [Methanoculleus horonobensis]
MNRQEHVTIGLFAFIAYSFPLYLITDKIPNGFIFGLFAVAIGSIIPDILEPATSWKHRGKYHSKRALKYILTISTIAAILGYISIIFATSPILYIASGLFLGYSLHLLADSITPMGLPD